MWAPRNHPPTCLLLEYTLATSSDDRNKQAVVPTHCLDYNPVASTGSTGNANPTCHLIHTNPPVALRIMQKLRHGLLGGDHAHRQTVPRTYRILPGFPNQPETQQRGRIRPA